MATNRGKTNAAPDSGKTNAATNPKGKKCNKH